MELFAVQVVLLHAKLHSYGHAARTLTHQLCTEHYESDSPVNATAADEVPVYGIIGLLDINISKLLVCATKGSV